MHICVQFISEKSWVFLFVCFLRKRGWDSAWSLDFLIWQCCFYAYFYPKQAGMLLPSSAIKSLIGVLLSNLICKLLLFSWIPFVTWNSLCRVKSFVFLSPFEFDPKYRFSPVYFLVTWFFLYAWSGRGWVPLSLHLFPPVFFFFFM